jgi:radical SAM superfamily enzyme YgiQ (UPF0313 family)
MTDVLFTHSYFLRFDPKEFRAMMPYPPLGTLYAAACTREAGFTVSLFDSMFAESASDISGHLAAQRPRAVVMYDDDFNYLTKMCLTRMRHAAFEMSELARNAECAVIVHGSDASDHCAEYLAHGADYVIIGEGEQTLVELLNLLLSGKGRAADIPGLAYMQGNEVVHTEARRVLKDLDSLPFPARDLLDIGQYREAWTKRHGYYSLNIVTTRGCPFHCNWCAKPIYGQVYNCRSPQSVVAEMRFLKETLNPDHIWFCDDIFGLKPGWVAEFRDEVLRQEALIPFKCLARVDLLLKGNTVSDLREAGCRTVWVGAESGSQKILDAMDKGTTVDQIYEASRLLTRHGIGVGFFLQYGYPGELQDDIALTMKMVRDCSPDEIGISVSYPLPGTPFYDSVRLQLGEKQNWVDSQDLAMMFQGTYTPAFYRILHKVTHKKFRLWKVTELLRNVLGHRPVPPLNIRSLAAAMYHWFTLPLYEARLGYLSRTRRATALAPRRLRRRNHRRHTMTAG